MEPFDIDDYTRWRLMEGLDDIGLTLRHEDAISAFEATRPSFLPATLSRGPACSRPAYDRPKVTGRPHAHSARSGAPRPGLGHGTSPRCPVCGFRGTLAGRDRVGAGRRPGSRATGSLRARRAGGPFPGPRGPEIGLRRRGKPAAGARHDSTGEKARHAGNIRPGYCVAAPDRLISGWSGVVAQASSHKRGLPWGNAGVKNEQA